jgi:hypothetical protein
MDPKEELYLRVHGTHVKRYNEDLNRNHNERVQNTASRIQSPT